MFNFDISRTNIDDYQYIIGIYTSMHAFMQRLGRLGQSHWPNRSDRACAHVFMHTCFRCMQHVGIVLACFLLLHVGLNNNTDVILRL